MVDDTSRFLLAAIGRGDRKSLHKVAVDVLRGSSSGSYDRLEMFRLWFVWPNQVGGSEQERYFSEIALLR